MRLFLAAAIVVVTCGLVGCMPGYYESEGGVTYVADGGGARRLPLDEDMVQATRGAARLLLNSMHQGLPADEPILVSSFVNIDDLTQSSTFGRIVAEQIASNVAQHGFKVVEMSSVAIASSDSRPGFEIWPNPATEAVQVNWSGAPATLEILDMAGRIVRSNTLVLQGTNSIPLACAPGAYLVRIRGNGTLATRRLIVQ